MSLFLKKIALFILIPVLLLVIGVILPTYPAEENSHLFGRIEKDSLLRNTPSPRIILIGGSSMAFGINGQLIRDSLHINPINVGLDYNIGLSYLTSNVLPYIREGDKVVVASEYEGFLGRLVYGGYPVPMIEFKITPGHLGRLTMDQWINMFRLIPAFAIKRLKVWKYFTKDEQNHAFYRRSFNEYGDNTGHWGKPPVPFTPIKGYDGEFNPAAVACLKNFSEQLEKKKAHLYISFPPYQTTTFNYDQAQIKQIENALRHEHFTILGTPEQFKMPDSLIFDSPYHFVKEGVDRRTALLIADLKQAASQTNR